VLSSLSVEGPDVVLEGVRKIFRARGAPEHLAVNDVSLRVERGERVVIVGPSGCGKSTLLRLIAGLDDPDAGSIFVGGRDVRAVAPQDRNVAMVFQGYALYPHLSAFENIAFPLRMAKASREARARSVADVAKVLRIEHLLTRRPNELSGGERQRVAIGRALVRRPRVFLFDEPLSNLDAALRNDLRVELAQIFLALSGACLYVTHDQVEAMTLADRIVVMNQGRVLQVATPRDVYESPADAFVAAFMGAPKMNLVEGRIDDGALAFGPFRLEPPRTGLPERLLVGVRPQDLAIDARGVPAEVLAAEPHGAETVLSVRAGSTDLRVRTEGFDVRRPGETVHVRADASRLHLFAADGTNARLA
jgi:multiple sugar transport system ATP-binding protein